MKNSQHNFLPLIIFYVLFYPLINLEKRIFTNQYNSNSLYANAYKNKAKISLSFIFFTPKKDYQSTLGRKILSQEILINGIDNTSLKSKLMLFLSIPINNNAIFDLKDIESWVNRMRFSGFFSTIEYFTHSIESHQIVEINVEINPILKQVSILNYYDKVIPYSYILIAFRNQLGYPINFIHLNKAFSLITQWYYIRGYKLARVKLVNINQINHSLTISVEEGRVKRLEIRGEKFLKTSISPYSLISIPVILNIINVKINGLFNSHYIEEGLAKLENDHIISQGSYKINKEDRDLSLIIYLEPKDSKSVYLFSRKTLITNSVLEKLETFIHSSLSHIINNNVYAESIYEHLGQDNLLLQNNNLTTRMTAYTRMDRSDENIYSLPHLILMQHWHKIYELFLNNIFLISNYNFGFRYYMYNIGIQNNCLLVDSSFLNTGKYFSVQYSHSMTQLFKNIRHQINCKILKENTKYLYQHQYVTPNKYDTRKLHSDNYLLSHRSLSINSKEDLNLNINIDRELSLKSTSYQYLSLHYYENWSKLRDPLQGSNLIAVCSKVKNLWHHNIEIFIKLHWKVKYNTLCRISNPKKLSLKSVHIIPSHSFYRSNIFCSKYNYINKIIIFSKKRVNIYKYRILFSGLVIKLFGEHVYLPASEQTLLIGPSLIRGYPENMFPLPRQFGKISVECSVPIASYSTLLFFIDYAQGIRESYEAVNCYDDFSCTHFLKAIRHDYRLGYGLGLQIQMPLKQIPPLRLEYAYNLDSGRCFHIRIEKNKL